MATRIDAARRVPRREPLEPVNVTQPGGRGADPPLPHAALQRADGGVEGPRPQAGAHQTDLRPFEPRQRAVAPHLEEVVRPGRVSAGTGRAGAPLVDRDSLPTRASSYRAQDAEDTPIKTDPD